MKLDDDRMYEILLAKDPAYEGQFFVGVKTTGIFCRPTCTARKPKRENVEFFDTAKEAIHCGFIPCKKCRPMDVKEKIPTLIHDAMQWLDENPQIRITDWELKQKGMDPLYLRNWFKKNHNMTFQAYMRARRIGLSLKKIQEGEKVTDVAFDHGYESLSGFTAAFKKEIGASPTNNKTAKIINITRIKTPIGQMYIGATDEGVCLLEFTDRRMLETELKTLQKLLNANILYGSNPHLDLVEKELSEYFAGTRKVFSVPLVTPGTDFQQSVWKVLTTIPYGSTRSYKQQAELLGNPAAVRAVANANGANRIAIVIPCHRVIGENGKLVGYGGGLQRKQFLLDLEQRNNAN